MSSFLPSLSTNAANCIARCRALALHTEEAGHITRLFLAPSMHAVHADVRGWMLDAGMSVSVDAAGNIRGAYPGAEPDAPVLVMGSHLDTVPRAGAFDGILGVTMAIELVKLLGGRRRKFAIEAIGFSEEEGVRFGVPFLGSRTVIGDVDDALLRRTDAIGVTVADAIREFGLMPEKLSDAVLSPTPLGYFEFHIEQGPVLESLGLPLAVVDKIVGQTRLGLMFQGRANHAGTTPMGLRRDALAGAAEWIVAVEAAALASEGLVATVGRIEAEPGAGNVIPGRATLSLDVRHADDAARCGAVVTLVELAQEIAARRHLQLSYETLLEQASVAMDAQLSGLFPRDMHRMSSGAGHDAMILARRMPATMLFLRSPGGISHHPNEAIFVDDVAAALNAGLNFFEALEATL